jgi:hypothetical protein
MRRFLYAIILFAITALAQETTELFTLDPDVVLPENTQKTEGRWCNEFVESVNGYMTEVKDVYLQGTGCWGLAEAGNDDIIEKFNLSFLGAGYQLFQEEGIVDSLGIKRVVQFWLKCDKFILVNLSGPNESDSAYWGVHMMAALISKKPIFALENSQSPCG